MVTFNHQAKEMTIKIVYYGPGLCGKTTNLQFIHDNLKEKDRGKLVSLATETDRTLFFDLMNIKLGTVGGFKTRVQLFTVPGQTFYDATRRLVLNGADGVVFVADSQEKLMDSNTDALDNLELNLKKNGYDPEAMPLVFQWNKRDASSAMSVSEMQRVLDPDRRHPAFPAVAISGEGVFETMKAIVKLSVGDIQDRYFHKGKLQQEKFEDSQSIRRQAWEAAGAGIGTSVSLAGGVPKGPIVTSSAEPLVAVEDIPLDPNSESANRLDESEILDLAGVDDNIARGVVEGCRDQAMVLPEPVPMAELPVPVPVPPEAVSMGDLVDSAFESAFSPHESVSVQTQPLASMDTRQLPPLPEEVLSEAPVVSAEPVGVVSIPVPTDVGRHPDIEAALGMLTPMAEIPPMSSPVETAPSCIDEPQDLLAGALVPSAADEPEAQSGTLDQVVRTPALTDEVSLGVASGDESATAEVTPLASHTPYHPVPLPRVALPSSPSVPRPAMPKPMVPIMPRLGVVPPKAPPLAASAPKMPGRSPVGVLSPKIPGVATAAKRQITLEIPEGIEFQGEALDLRVTISAGEKVLALCSDTIPTPGTGEPFPVLIRILRR